MKTNEKKVFDFTGFAEWYFENILPAVKNYKGDCFYDVALLTNKRNESSGNLTNEVRETYFLYVRENGTYLVQETSDLASYAKYSERAYKIEFCFNFDYFSTPFAKIEEIKLIH